MARTADQLNNSEVLMVQTLDNLGNTATTESVAKVGGTFVNRATVQVGALVFK
jgi:hypothetical protein